jgi:hypothetical protein
VETTQKPQSGEVVIQPKPILGGVGVQPPVGVQPAVVKKLPTDNNTRMKLIALALVVVLLGVGTGYVLSGTNAKTGGPAPTSDVAEKPAGGDTAVNESVFSDTATGVLHEGGIEGEGTHYLDTGNGPEKYVYLLSTIMDLQSFVGKKIEVHGQTLGAESAGWLMDVGQVKIVD